MSDQNTLLRCIEMMAILSNHNGKTVQELADYFEKSTRTIHRTIDTIKMAGYVIENQHGRYKINKNETRATNGFDISDLLHFTKEEAWLLDEAISNITGENTIKENLVRKLYSIYDTDVIITNMTRKEESEQVKTISDAIQNKLQIHILEYNHTSAGWIIRTKLTP